MELMKKAQKDEKILIQYRLNNKIIGKQKVRARTLVKNPMYKAYNIYLLQPYITKSSNNNNNRINSNRAEIKYKQMNYLGYKQC